MKRELVPIRFCLKADQLRRLKMKLIFCAILSLTLVNFDVDSSAVSVAETLKMVN